MNDDDKIRIELLYGNALVSSNAHMHGRIVGPPGPRNKLEAAWWALMALWQEVIVPALLFALAFTAFKFAVLGHF